MFDLCVTLVLIIILICTLYFSLKARHKYWKRLGIPYLVPKHLLLGNTSDVFLNGVPLFEYHAKVYRELAPHKYGGYFNLLTPVLVLRDPELIKNILSKHFSNFMSRSDAFTDYREPMTLHIFNLSGELWRYIRKKITPAFSSNKMKFMFQRMKNCSEQLISEIDQNIGKEFETRDLMARTFVAGFLESFFPKLRRALRLKLFSSDLSSFFEHLVKITIRTKEESDSNKNDFIGILTALKEVTHSKEDMEEMHYNKFEFNDNFIIGQCFVFFAAGFETSSGTSSFALYELAKHPEIQNRLFIEIQSVLKTYNNDITYECLNAMTYLDQVVSETLRMYPVLPFLSRKCTATYELDDKCTINSGTRVIIPVLGLHMDPQYYDNPSEFNPENFSKSAKNGRPNFTFLPFGEGPRNCIGMRFGLTQVKLSLVAILNNYEIRLSCRMEHVDLKFKKLAIVTTPEGGLWLIFRRRNQE